MKVFSIIFESTSPTGQLGLFTTAAFLIEDAISVGRKRLTNEKGDLGWTPNMANYIEIKMDTPVEVKPQEDTQVEKLKENKNWALSLIVENNDVALFECIKKYLTESEIKYIDDKIIPIKHE